MVLAKDAKRKSILVLVRADTGAQRDLAVGLATWFHRRRDRLEGNAADLGNCQAALQLTTIHLLTADGGRPVDREVLRLAGVVNQDDLLLNLLARNEVVILGRVGADRPGDPRQRWAVIVLKFVLYPGPGAQAARKPCGPPTTPGIDAVEALDLEVISVLIQSVLGAVVEHPCAEQASQVLPILWFLRLIRFGTKIDGGEFREQGLTGDITCKPMPPTPEGAVHGGAELHHRNRHLSVFRPGA